MAKRNLKIYMILNRVITDKIFLRINYLLKFKRLPNLRNPKRYSEKIQIKMISDEMFNYTNYVDKYLVRDYIKEKIGEKYLIKLLGVYDSVNEINFEALPNKFIMKTNHGSGYFIICEDKDNFDKDNCKKYLDRCMKENYYNKCREKQYKNIKRKIICEELVGNIEKEFLDVRIFCFNGKPDFIQVDSGFAYGKTTRMHYDLEWNELEFDMKQPRMKKSLKKPKRLKELIGLAEELCKEFNHVRVDFYLSDNNIYFSELTFTPAGGRSIITPDKYDFILGDKLNG